MFRKVLLFCALTGLFSCSIQQNDTVEEQIGNPIPAVDKTVYDLGEHGLPLIIEAPGGVIDSLDVYWEPAFGRLEIQSKSGAHLFIQNDTLSCTAKISELENGVLNNDFIDKSDSLLIYKTTASEGQLAYYHFFASFQIDSTNYTFQNNPLVEYSEADIRRMTRLVSRIEGS